MTNELKLMRAYVETMKKVGVADSQDCDNLLMHLDNIDKKLGEKRIFQVLDDMNQDDTKNGTTLVAVSKTLISADKVKQGAKIAMGVEERYLYSMLKEETLALLLMIDKKDYLNRK